MSKNKILSLIVMILLTTSTILIVMPDSPIKTVSAQLVAKGGSPMTAIGMPTLGPLPSGVTPQYTIATTAYMSVTPDPVGIGQSILINVWTSPGMYHAFYMGNYKVDIIKPDGTTATIGPYNSYLGDATDWFQYTVDQAGTWQFKFEQPGTYLPATNYTDEPGFGSTGGGLFSTPGNQYYLGASVLYTASSTNWQNLTVQQDIVASWPSAPLPTDYWKRPISAENRDWWSIAGSYPFTSAVYYSNGRVLYSSNYKYTAYVQAPNTCHIVWRRQGNLAGLIGGEAYQSSTFSGGGNPNIFYAGRAYQAVTKTVNGQQTSYYESYDIRTGQIYWDIPVPTTYTSFFGFLFPSTVSPSCVTYEQSAPFVAGEAADLTYSAYLVAITSTNLIKWDPYSGTVSANISLPSGLSAQSPGAGFFGMGGVPVYSDPWVYSIQTIGFGPTTQYRLINWSIAGSSTDFNSRIGSNISWPMSSLGTVDFNAGISVTASWASPPGPQWCIGYDITSIDLHTGQTLFHITSNDSLTYNMQGASLVVDRGKIAFDCQNRHWACWDGRTGQPLWTSQLSGYPWGNWWAYSTASYDFNESKGALIECAYDGIYAIDWDNGNILWHYSSSMAPFESPYGGEPFFTGLQIADGKVYTYGGEHTTTEPITRGWHLHCINATTGDGIWKITGPSTPGVFGDGYMTASDPYDGYTYVFGKGQSQTTVSAPINTVTSGTSVLIQGTVMDKSPGDQGSIQNPTAPLDSTTKPGTVPCVSAASMQTEMEYLYMQHPQDGIYHNITVTGVPVLLMAFDSSNNPVTIGTVTSDLSGNFQYSWTPTTQGIYKITATFAGDDSYGSSWAETGLNVGVTPSTTTAPTPTPIAQTDYMPTLTGILAAVIVAIVISIIALAFVIRNKRP